MVRAILELIRIMVIVFVFGGVMGAVIKAIHTQLGFNLENTNGGWLVGISIFLLVFVLYRNKLQFSGFYKDNKKEKLPRKVSAALILCSFLLLVIAPLISL
ncbi:hypothetical protein AWM68_02630 [Fictibacillus phosphorivorans]|uniref:Uncharacterized protein n=1 Tax=Fictibacillus phosphorivorans TaxID=1221500 RepID=A0A163SIQ0_9BACL|nr:hypothetical protein [Fictibacillus phosphorivorans]KZE69182.1 hypothetical protein AWM68_02630 [Fictibacillus phosphorivorans]